MRVHLSRTRDDDGAVAIIVAILSLAFVVLAAIAVDFGNAYAVKRQLSVAADAAALAAGQALNAELPVGTTCASKLAALKTTAQSVATSINEQNDLSDKSTVSSVDVFCADNGVRVTVTNSRVLNTVFGGVIGVATLTPQGSATSILQVPKAFLGLRPIAACATTVAAATTGVKVPFVIYISTQSGTSGAVCGGPANGQWGFTNFLNQGSFGTFNDPNSASYFPAETCANNGGGNGAPAAGGDAGCQSEWFNSGYGGRVYIPNSTATGDTGIAGNTGLSNSSDYVAALKSLVGQTIQVPVATNYVAAPGTDRINTVGVASVNVCSINFGKQGSSLFVYSTGSHCSQNAPAVGDPDYATWQGLANNEGALYVEPVEYVTSGIFGGRSDCTIGNAACDFGTRTVALYQ